jgi:hypothetical protein
MPGHLYWRAASTESLPNRIACAGHPLMHPKQSAQWSPNTILPLFMVIFPAGHMRAQSPQRVHFSSDARLSS